MAGGLPDVPGAGITPPSATPARSQRFRLPDAAWSVIGVACSLGFLAPLLAVAGADIGTGYHSLFTASFGSTFAFSYLLLASSPLILVGVGVALRFRAGLFNLGGEGQLLIGGLAAVEVALAVPGAGSSVSGRVGSGLVGGASSASAFAGDCRGTFAVEMSSGTMSTESMLCGSSARRSTRPTPGGTACGIVAGMVSSKPISILAAMLLPRRRVCALCLSPGSGGSDAAL